MKILETQSIYPENAQIRKVRNGRNITYEVLQASVHDRSLVEFRVNGSPNIIRLVAGDHSKELVPVCGSLVMAKLYATNSIQADFIEQYLRSFYTSDLEASRESQRLWVKDLKPPVEANFWFC